MSVSTLTIALLLVGTAADPIEAQSAPTLTTASVEQVQPSAAPMVVVPPPVTPLPPAESDSPDLPAMTTEEKVDPVDEEDDAIVVTAGQRIRTPGDPLEQINEESYAIVQGMDKVLVAPAAKAYSKTIPAPVRSGLRNFFNNLAEPIVFLNYMLQLKPGKAFETLGRFAINSTVGVAGLFDMAKRKPFNLPLRRNGLANTLGFYGVKPGAFLFLPLVGPTTVRDLIGLSLDKLLLPTAIGAPFNQPYYAIPSTMIGSIDYRVEFDEQLTKIQNSDDPYAASRDNYLKTRQAEIDALRGRTSEPVAPGTGPLVAPQIKTLEITPEAPPPLPDPVPSVDVAPAPELVPNF